MIWGVATSTGLPLLRKSRGFTNGKKTILSHRIALENTECFLRKTLIQIIPNFRHSQISSFTEYLLNIPMIFPDIPNLISHFFFMDTMINLQNPPPAVSSKQLCSSSRKVDLVDGCGLKNWTVPGKYKGHLWNYGTLMMTIGRKLRTHQIAILYIYIIHK